MSPVTTCCGSPNLPYGTGASFIVNVVLNLTSGDQINLFDVSLNYSNPETGMSPGVLHAVSVDYSRNIFSSLGGNVLVECIDGIQQQGSTGCPKEVIGQVHLAEVIYGQPLSGPLSGILFSINFQVTGNGNSTFLIDRSNLSNPIPDPSNSQLIDPYYIPVLKYGGIFGNSGVIAFFNYVPVDSSITPALLPNQDVIFDGTASFVPSNSSTTIQSYSWNFGDGTTGTGATILHKFPTSGNFTVLLQVTDSKNNSGGLSRRVPVSPALGTLTLTVEDKRGSVHRGDVVVKVFNSSTSLTPFTTKIIDNFGNAQFKGLTPSNYYLTFSGASIDDSSKVETVKPGWNTIDTVFVADKPSLSDNSGFVYLGTIIGGLGLVTVAIVYARARSARKKPASDSRRSIKKGRTSR